jgi:hypothetical protein
VGNLERIVRVFPRVAAVEIEFVVVERFARPVGEDSARYARNSFGMCRLLVSRWHCMHTSICRSRFSFAGLTIAA